MAVEGEGPRRCLSGHLEGESGAGRCRVGQRIHEKSNQVGGGGLKVTAPPGERGWWGPRCLLTDAVSSAVDGCLCPGSQ